MSDEWRCSLNFCTRRMCSGKEGIGDMEEELEKYTYSVVQQNKTAPQIGRKCYERRFLSSIYELQQKGEKIAPEIMRLSDELLK